MAAYEKGDYETARREFRPLAEQGHVEAQYHLGECYYGYTGEDNDEAEKWYREAAGQGHAEAMYKLSLIYRYGLGVDEDDAKAMEWYRKAAEKGLVGNRDHGDDNVEALEWYRKAAEKGNAKAMYKLGMMYEYYNQGVEQDDAKALEWYRKAAEKGNAKAMYELGMMYEYYDQGVEQDDAKALEWYRKAAEKGHAEAMIELGMMYRYGQGVEEDGAEALEWHRKATEKGNAEAMIKLGGIYSEGYIHSMRLRKWYDVVDMDSDPWRQAIKWYRKAAEKGHAEAMIELGMMYHYGRGVDKDPVEAEKWYRKAAKKEYDGMVELHTLYYYQGMALCKIGDIYALGVDKDPVEAEKWYRKAAEKEYDEAIIELGDMYAGKPWHYYYPNPIVPQDEIATYMWYKISTDGGSLSLGVYSDDFDQIVKSLSSRLTTDQRAEAHRRTREWYHKVAEKGNVWAMHRLGNMYADEDYVKAHMWYNLILKYGAESIDDIRRAAQSLNSVAENMTPEQIAEAQHQAREWAAEQGYAKAQYALGLVYENGTGVRQDYVEAHMWYNLAAAQGDMEASGNRDRIAKQMTADQIAEAQRRARDWSPNP